MRYTYLDYVYRQHFNKSDNITAIFFWKYGDIFSRGNVGQPFILSDPPPEDRTWNDDWWPFLQRIKDIKPSIVVFAQKLWRHESLLRDMSAVVHHLSSFSTLVWMESIPTYRQTRKNNAIDFLMRDKCRYPSLPRTTATLGHSAPLPASSSSSGSAAPSLWDCVFVHFPYGMPIRDADFFDSKHFKNTSLYKIRNDLMFDTLARLNSSGL